MNKNVHIYIFRYTGVDPPPFLAGFSAKNNFLASLVTYLSQIYGELLCMLNSSFALKLCHYH